MLHGGHARCGERFLGRGRPLVPGGAAVVARLERARVAQRRGSGAEGRREAGRDGRTLRIVRALQETL